MNGNAPHFVLFSEASRCGAAQRSEKAKGWRFILQTANGEDRFVASDMEPGTGGERLELLAVVRGLEALDQPSRVTLVTRSRYVSRGLRAGLQAWRESGWQWERFGKMVPVKNRDLWQRVEQALKFHRVECRRWRIDAPHRPKGQGDPRSGRPETARAEQTRPHARRVSQGGQRSIAGPWGSRSSQSARVGGQAGRVPWPWHRLVQCVARWLPVPTGAGS
jgi:ribonuclease HI